MTIKVLEDYFEVECDLCGTSETFEKDLTARFSGNNGFMEMIDKLKEDGWKIYKSDIDEWNHLCPGCNSYEE